MWWWSGRYNLGSLLGTLAELHPIGAKLVIQDQPHDAATVEAGGRTAAADLLVDARRRYRTEAIRAWKIRAKGCGTRFGRTP
jgi:hypothetical protein